MMRIINFVIALSCAAVVIICIFMAFMEQSHPIIALGAFVLMLFCIGNYLELPD